MELDKSILVQKLGVNELAQFRDNNQFTIVGDVVVEPRTYNGVTEQKHILSLCHVSDKNVEQTYKFVTNKTSLQKCAKTWGLNTTKWVGKLVRIKSVNQLVKGQERVVLYAEPVVLNTSQPLGAGKVEEVRVS